MCVTDSTDAELRVTHTQTLKNFVLHTLCQNVPFPYLYARLPIPSKINSGWLVYEINHPLSAHWDIGDGAGTARVNASIQTSIHQKVGLNTLKTSRCVQEGILCILHLK